MVKVKISGDERLLESLKRYSKSIDNDVSDFVDDVARSGGRLLVQYTQPFGLAGSAQRTGAKAVSKDIAKVYAGFRHVAKRIRERSPRACAIYSSEIERGDFVGAANVARRVLGADYEVGSFDSGRLHESSRNSKGRVVSPQSKLAVMESGATSEYHAKKAERVGFAKAGWITAMRGLTKTRFGKWLTKHLAPGHMTKRKNGLKKEISLTNGVPYVSEILTQGQVRKAQTSAVKNTLKRYLKIFEARARQMR